MYLKDICVLDVINNPIIYNSSTKLGKIHL